MLLDFKFIFCLSVSSSIPALYCFDEVSVGGKFTKIRLIKSGADNKPTVFLFCDTQIVEESFLEDINNTARLRVADLVEKRRTQFSIRFYLTTNSVDNEQCLMFVRCVDDAESIFVQSVFEFINVTTNEFTDS